MEKGLSRIVWLIAISSAVKGLTVVPTQNSSYCNGWITYENEKCLKIVDKEGLSTKMEAENVCKSLSSDLSDNKLPRLITVKNKEEQKFLQKFLFIDKKVDGNVWLGLTENTTTGQMEWSDGSKMTYSNLANPNENGSNYKCVEINKNQSGLWLKVECTKQNNVVCELESKANFDIMQQDANVTGSELIEIKPDCREKISKSEHKIDVLKEAAEKAKHVLQDATDQIEEIEKIEKRLIEGGQHKRTVQQTSRCGDWTPYKDQKCFKIVISAGYRTQEEAEAICEAFSESLNSESYPKLVTIKTREEQKFLERFLFNENKMFNNVWLGLKEDETSGKFEWNDGSDVFISDHLGDLEASEDQRHCVEMESGKGARAVGLWTKVDCKKENFIVCERLQTWTLETLQNAFLNNRLEQEEQTKKLETKILKQANEIGHLKKTTVPIGFIYVQLPSQDPPNLLWPSTNWTDVSSSYAGLFFRVVGGEAAPFGQIQEGNTTRLESVNFDTKSGYPEIRQVTVPSDGTWSEWVKSGYYDSTSTTEIMRFRLLLSEVRPRNQAIKVWKRIE